MAPPLRAANTNRPTEYDRQVIAYTPYVRRMAYKWCSRHPANGDPADFVQDVMTEAFHRYPLYDAKYTFGVWMRFICRVIMDRRKKKSMTYEARARRVPDDGAMAIGVPANQQECAELSQVLARLTGRGGEIIVRCAMGDELGEIGADMGISKERVRQLKNVARSGLVKSLNNVRRVV